MIEIKVYLGSQIAHYSQIYTGLAMLEERKIVSIQFAQDDLITRHDSSLLRIEANGKMLVFDLADHGKVQEGNIYDSADFYFKRMLSKGDSIKFFNVFPYGLNYAVFHTNDHIIKRSFVSKDIKLIFKNIARRWMFLANNLNINLSYSNCLVSDFESYPIRSENPKIIYYTRLWNPEKTKSAEKKHERIEMNELRVNLVNALRRKFKQNFIGAIYRDAYSTTIAGEALAINNSELHKTSYLNSLRSSCIGIADPGLEMSLGFKIGEYVAMSKAIISTPINTVLPGDFQSGKNFLPYSNVQECVTACERLLDNADALHLIKENNFTYYHQFLRPDILVFNCLKNVL